MGCCIGGLVGREEIGPRNHLIIDVQQIIADDAWEEFLISTYRTCKIRRRWLKRSDYTLEVPMNYYLFQVTRQEFQKNAPLPSLHTNDSGTQVDSSRALFEQANPDHVGLKTKFRNDTDKDQTYNFRLEKTRTASVEVTYQKGFSIGGSANFAVGLPKVLPDGQLSSEISMNYEVTSAKGQTFEETLTTEATSEIVVSRYTHCTANVVMEERRLLANFKLWVKMSMPEKEAVVIIKDKTGRVVFLKVIQDLSLLFPPDTHIQDDKGEIRQDAVQFQIHGVVDGRQLANHYIHLKSEKIDKNGKAQRAKAAKTDNAKSQKDKSGGSEDEKNFSDVDISGME